MSSTLLVVLVAIVVVAAVLALLERGFRLITRARVDAEQARLEIERLTAEREKLRSGTAEVLAELSEPLASRGGGGQPTPSIPRPEPPDGLRHAIAAGECVLFAGAAFPAQAGYRPFPMLLEEAIDTVESRFPDEPWSSVRAQVRSGSVDVAVELLRTRLGSEQLDRILREGVGSEPSTSSTLQALSEVPFAGTITVDWTGTVLHTLAQLSPLVITPSRISGAAEALRDGQYFLLEASGDVRDGPLFLTADDMRKAASANREYAQFVVSLLTTRSLLFLGSSLREIEQFLNSVDLPTNRPRRHWALVPWQASTELENERFETRYGVQLMSYQPDEGHEATAMNFSQQLRDSAPRRDPSQRRAPVEAERLEQVTLRNIGPFDELHIELDGHTILLGDNGSGKSSVLRAIALALAGDTATASMAGRLLKTTADFGDVELHTARNTYATRLVRDGSRVRVESGGLSPIRTTAWLALGFPAIRGVSTVNPRGPTGAVESEPVPEDLLPLLSNGPDLRLDALKQWVVNTALRAEETSPNPTRDAELLERFFTVLGDLTPGVQFEYAGIDRSTWEVLLDSPDGPLSFDLLSRGMTAIMGWIGVLLQRLYEVYGGRDGDPQNERALVLVDEIDVHLHPEWQHIVLPLVVGHFPGVQLIATTHSPLVVGNARDGEVRVLQRDANTLTLRRLEGQFSGWRSDQILTSAAFAMDSTRDQATAGKHAEYRALMARGETPANSELAARLQRELEADMPAEQETPAEREAVSLFRDWLQERLQTRPPAMREQIIGEGELYLKRLYSGGD